MSSASSFPSRRHDPAGRPSAAWHLLGAALLAGCAALTSPTVEAAPLNLILNGDAEAGAGVSNDLSVSVDIPHWTRASGSAATAVRYGAAGGFPLAGAGPSDAGLNFFAGGPTTAATQLTQLVDLQAYAGRAFTLSGWFGGWQAQNDDALLTVSFLDAQALELSAASVGGVTAADRGNATQLLLRSLDGVIPAGTTQMRVTLDMRYKAGAAYNDGYADNLSFVVHDLPEPGVALLLLVALGGAGFARRSAARPAHAGRAIAHACALDQAHWKL